MNCTECGAPFVLGRPHNPNCAKTKAHRIERDRRLDILLKIFEKDIDAEINKDNENKQ